MTILETLSSKYFPPNEGEDRTNYIKRIVKKLEADNGFAKAHTLLLQQFKKMTKDRKEYTQLQIKIIGNEQAYAKALSAI